MMVAVEASLVMTGLEMLVGAGVGLGLTELMTSVTTAEVSTGELTLATSKILLGEPTSVLRSEAFATPLAADQVMDFTSFHPQVEFLLLENL